MFYTLVIMFAGGQPAYTESYVMKQDCFAAQEAFNMPGLVFKTQRTDARSWCVQVSPNGTVYTIFKPIVVVPPRTTYYKVKAGDSLTSIASLAGSDIASNLLIIRYWNNMTPDDLPVIGQVLQIPVN